MSLDDYPIDEDYIDPPRQKADIEREESDGDSERDEIPAAYSNRSEWRSRTLDWSHTYGRDGTFDDEIDQESPQSQVREPMTRTVFDYTESNDREKWKRLRKWQDGMWASSGVSRGSQNARADNMRAVRTYGSVLDITTYQRDRCEAVVDSINFAHMAHYDRETIVLAVISLVANEDGRWIRDEKAYRSLIKDVDTSLTAIRKCRLLLKDKSDLL